MDAIVTVDADQRIVLFNSAAVARFGWPEDEALGTPLKNLILPRLRDGYAAEVRAFVTNRTAGKPRPLIGLRRDDLEFPIEASISQADVNGRKLLTFILRDVTARRRAQSTGRCCCGNSRTG